MDTVMLFGGPRDGQIETVRDFYLVDGTTTRREGWPLILEVRTYDDERPPDSAASKGQGHAEGQRIARYRLTERVTEEGHQVYEHIPD